MTWINLFWLIYVLPCGLYLYPLVCVTLHISWASVNCYFLSAQKSLLYLLPSYWLFSFLLNQSQQYIFPQRTNIPQHSHTKCAVLEIFQSHSGSRFLCLLSLLPWMFCSRFGCGCLFTSLRPQLKYHWLSEDFFPCFVFRDFASTWHWIFYWARNNHFYLLSHLHTQTLELAYYYTLELKSLDGCQLSLRERRGWIERRTDGSEAVVWNDRSHNLGNLTWQRWETIGRTLAEV